MSRDFICEVHNEERRFCNRTCQKNYYVVWMQPPPPPAKSAAAIPDVHAFPDKGGFAVDIEAATMVNPFFRRELWTLPGSHQVMAMCILPAERDIGLERHKEAQFFRVEAGRGTAIVNGEAIPLSPGSALAVAPNAEHNILVAEGASEPLSLYTIYTPPHHAPGTFHARKADAVRAEEEENKGVRM
jgi:mannose-6-phosphate isomerase-like protein (cupin superfamily)